MENIAFKISEFASVMRGHCMDDDITIIKIDSSNNEQLNNIIEEHFLTRLRGEISCSFFTNTGEITATIDYKTYSASSSSILALAPHKILTQLYTSSDFSGYFMAFSRHFLEESTINRKPPISISQLVNADKSPKRVLISEDMEIMQTCIERILHYLKNKQHRLRKELLTNTFYTFMLEAANILFTEDQQSAPIEKSVKKTYIEKFIELLVQHAEKEHNPAFFADKLCISVQYLSLILKEVSGKTTNGWIANFLIARAKTMLRKPDITIQHITETLNFSDQSSFGKFFKKHVGISPKKYRESHMSI